MNASAVIVVVKIWRVFIFAQTLGPDRDIFRHVYVGTGVVDYVPDVHELSRTYYGAGR